MIDEKRILANGEIMPFQMVLELPVSLLAVAVVVAATSCGEAEAEDATAAVDDDDDDDDGVEMMLKAVAEQVRAEQAEKVGNHFAAEAVKKEWMCSACTFINQATEDACAMCDKENTKEKDDHDVWLAKRESWREARSAVKKP